MANMRSRQWMLFDTSRSLRPMLGRMRTRPSLQGASSRPLRTAGLVLVGLAISMTAVACNKSEPEEPPLINDYVSGIQVIGDVSATSEVINQQLGEGSEDGPQAETESTA